jgi:hypothetical protein
MKNLRTGTAKFDTIRAKDASGLHIQDDAGNGLFIKDGGNVGIGTTSPDKLFHVETNDTSTNAIAKFKNAGDGDATLQIGNATTNFVIGMDNSDSDKFKLGYGDALESITGMTIDSSANVGIGTTNPVYNLQVQASTPIVSIVSNVDSSSRLNLFERIGSGQSLGAFIKYNGTTNALELGNTVNDSDAVNISVSRVSGNVGIGTTNPNAKLEVKTAENLHMRVGSLAPEISPIVRFQGQSSLGQNWYGDIQLDAEDGIFSMFAPNTVGPIVKSLNIIQGGNVGIGTTSPDSKLHLSTTGLDGLRLSVDSQSYYHMIRPNGDGLYIGADEDSSGGSGADIRLNIKGDEKMRIDSNGNVGIGTTSPQHKLDISTDDTNGLRLINPAAAKVNQSNDPPAILFQANGWDTNVGSRAYSARIRVNSNYSGASDRGNTHPVMNFDLETNENNPDDNLSTKMMINADGQVGIGTTDPNARLEVKTRNSDELAIRVMSANDNSLFDIRKSDNGDTEFLNTYYSASEGGLSGGFAFKTTDNASGAAKQTRMSILQNGRVGIGTTNPDKPLEIAQSDGTSGIRLNYIPSTYPNNYLADIYHDGGNGLILESKLGSATIAGDILLAPNGGNVGIGTTDPGSYKLNVNGAAFFSNTITVDATNYTSDDRVKHNEQPIVGALETLGKITPKKYIKTTEMYDANHDFELDADGNPINENGEPVEHRIEAGVIAQQVLTVDELAFAVSPEGVDEDGVVTSPHGLDYNSLFTYAIAAIQEQQEIIETQNSRIDELISRIETLEQ